MISKSISYFKKIFPVRNRMAVYVGNSIVLTETKYGHKMFVNSSDLSLSPHIIISGDWESWVTKAILGQTRPGMTVVEIGANIGFYTILLGHRITNAGTYYAFEANPKTFRILHNNVDINGLLERVKVENLAVYDKKGKLPFSSLAYHQGSSGVLDFSEAMLVKYQDRVSAIEVNSISLDEYFKGREQTIDLLKIDAEGSEPFIFDGMKNILTKNQRLIIFCEFGKQLIEPKRSAEKFLESIIHYGYTIHTIENSGHFVPRSVDDILRYNYAELMLRRYP